MATSSQGGTIKDRGEHLGRTIGEKADDLKTKGSDAIQSARDTAAGVGQQAQQFASNLGQKAQDFASTAATKTEDAITGVGERLTSLAGTIREKGPHDGSLGRATSTVADQLQAGGDFLQEHSLSDIGDELASVIRRYPVSSMLVGFGLGCLVAMAVTPNRR